MSKLRYFCQAFILLVLTVIPLFLFATASVATVCQTGTQAEGLISGKSVTGQFGNTTQNCILDTSALYANYKVKTFEDLKFTYFSQVKPSSVIEKIDIPNDADESALRFDGNKDFVVNIGGKLRIREPIGGNKTAIIFVKDRLDIESNLVYGNGTSGLVFIVKGDIYINESVQRIDAVLVSEGKICTAYNPAADSCTPVDTTPQLVVNGSIISIGKNIVNPIVFGRNLADNKTASAEVINQQAKYLVILKGLFTTSYTNQREVNLSQIPDITAPPPPQPPPPSPPSGTFCNGNPYKINASCLIDALVNF